ncbi:MAG TPA: CapA family protein [Gemmatimonadales bacterium]|nr:CapA family protein [Gemmatimonadales bacterium]
MMPTTTSSRPLTIALAGDVMLGRLVHKSLGYGDYARPWGDLLPALDRADLFAVNLECALTRCTERWSDGGYKPFYFRADPGAVATLKAGRVNVVSVANNHIGDFGSEGLRDTLTTLDAAGIAHAGAGVDRWSAREPALLTVRGTRVSVVAWADYPAEWAATPAAAGINYAPVSLEPEHFREIAVTLAIARERSDLVVFSIHWGPNMRDRPTREFRDFAHAVIDAGADIFWGHSAHVLQGAEFRRGRLILYDTGDLVDDYAVDPELRNDLSAVFLVRVRPPLVEAVDVVPVRIGDLQVNLARDPDRSWFLERFSRHCAEFGTRVTTDAPMVHLAAPEPEHTSGAAAG